MSLGPAAKSEMATWDAKSAFAMLHVFWGEVADGGEVVGTMLGSPVRVWSVVT